MRIDHEAKALTAVTGALGFVAALTLSAPMALADPLQSEPVIPIASPATPVDPMPAGPAPGPAPADVPVAAPAVVPVATPAVAPTPAAAPATLTPTPVLDGVVQPAAAGLPTPPDGVPHLSSLQNLPPGTTDTPPDNQGSGVSYLRDIWHAYQTQEVDGKGALLLLTQRPMDANAAPPPGMLANPTPPTAPLPPDAAPPAAPPAP